MNDEKVCIVYFVFVFLRGGVLIGFILLAIKNFLTISWRVSAGKRFFDNVANVVAFCDCEGTIKEGNESRHKFTKAIDKVSEVVVKS